MSKRNKLGVYAIMMIGITSIGCNYDGHYVAPPDPGAECREVTRKICEKIDSCLNPFEKIVLSEEGCNQKALGTVCALSSTVTYANECVREAIVVQCDPLRAFLLDSDLIAGVSDQCNTFFAKVKERVK